MNFFHPWGLFYGPVLAFLRKRIRSVLRSARLDHELFEHRRKGWLRTNRNERLLWFIECGNGTGLGSENGSHMEVEMKSKWRRVLVVVLASAFLGLGITTNAFSAPEASTEFGSSIINWGSIEVSGPVFTGDRFDRVYAYATWGSTVTDGPRQGTNLDVSATAMRGNWPGSEHAYATAWTAGGQIQVYYSGSVYSGSNEENGAAGRA